MPYYSVKQHCEGVGGYSENSFFFLLVIYFTLLLLTLSFFLCLVSFYLIFSILPCRGDSQQSGWTRVFLEPTDHFDVQVPPYKEARVGPFTVCY